MNKKILLFLLMLMPIMASAQTSRTIHVATAGTLSTLISEDEKYQIEELTLTGELNGSDIRFIRNMSGIDCDSKYHGIDIKTIFHARIINKTLLIEINLLLRFHKE